MLALKIKEYKKEVFFLMPLFMMTAWGCTSKQSSVYTLLRLILKTEWRNCLIECFWEKRFCN